MQKKSIAIDMDGVIADVDAHFINWYNRDYSEAITYEDIKGKTEENAFPVPGIIRKYANTQGFFRTVPVKQNAVEAVKLLNDQYEVYIVSAAMEFPQSLIEKKQWLEEHFPFISWKQIIFCGNKHVIATHFLIDDHPKNLDPFPGTGILFEAFHNMNVNDDFRVKKWDEVLTYFEIR